MVYCLHFTAKLIFTKLALNDFPAVTRFVFLLSIHLFIYRHWYDVILVTYAREEFMSLIRMNIKIIGRHARRWRWIGCNVVFGVWKFRSWWVEALANRERNFRIVSTRKTDQKTIPIKTKFKGFVGNAQKMLKVEKIFWIFSNQRKNLSGGTRRVPGKLRSYETILNR